jgi:hypothetical protein
MGNGKAPDSRYARPSGMSGTRIVSRENKKGGL